MPAKKTARVQARRRIINRRVRSSTRTAVKRATQVLRFDASGGARPPVVDAISALDRAAQKGVFHYNAAARHKSRLMKRLNESAAR